MGRGISKKAPREPGIYVFRLQKKFGRPRGETEILYIGRTQRDLRETIRHYVNPGPSQKTNKRIHDLLCKDTYKGKVEIGWCIRQKEEVKKLKRDFLDEFEKLYGRLPRWNLRK